MGWPLDGLGKSCIMEGSKVRLSITFWQKNLSSFCRRSKISDVRQRWRNSHRLKGFYSGLVIDMSNAVSLNK